MKVVSVDDVRNLLVSYGIKEYLTNLIQVVKEDFSLWDRYTKMPRPAMHVPGGVLELMPICDNEKYYTFKYVNCHPKNPEIGKQTVVATGQLVEIDTGYPLMISEMTVLTALRTAATSALATDLLARKDSETVVLIGTGAQSEFQIAALNLVRNIKEIRYFDIDEKAMNKFSRNMKNSQLSLIACSSAEEAVLGADIITICTACKANVDVIKSDWVKEGVHINALGGDTIGKTELELGILHKSRVVVEYFEQSYIEGEIQRLDEKSAKEIVVGELHELINKKKKGRTTDKDITVFDSVGIALEDYSVLRFTYELIQKFGLGTELELTPSLEDPKDLFSILS